MVYHNVDTIFFKKPATTQNFNQYFQVEHATGALDELHKFTKEDNTKKQVQNPKVAIKTMTTTKKQYSLLVI